MALNFTPNDLILYLYDECNVSKKKLIQKETKRNRQMHQDIRRLTHVRQALHRMKPVEINPDIVDAIKTFARH